jgi:3-deoxy-7-phosphoheptulonate synthase
MSNIIIDKWSPNSWRNENCNYPPLHELTGINEVVSSLRCISGVVSIHQTKELHSELINVSKRKSFIVQAGDCAELLYDNDVEIIFSKVNLLISLAKLIPLTFKSLIIGRIAGQYAKPRSFHYETRNSVTLPSYHGDLMNRFDFTAEARKIKPQYLIDAYHSSCEALKNINIVNSILQKKNNIYVSHEALHLYYEEALTRSSHDECGGWYNLSTHFPWLGMRAALDSDAHVEYFRGIKNPVAIKLGPLMAVDRLIKLIEILNPSNELGKITLIHRLGDELIQDILPKWISAISMHNKNVIWCCDPMHGNTEVTSSGIKTRRLSKILNELQRAFDIHNAQGSFLGGIHLEITPDQVTECIDDISVFEHNLTDNYKSLVDPRLNPDQASIVLKMVNNNL